MSASTLRSFRAAALMLLAALALVTSGLAQNVVSTLATGAQPVAVATNPATNTIYIANQSGNNVTVINGATGATNTVSVGAAPQAVAINVATNQIYVANYGSDTVTVISGATNTVADTIAVGSGPTALAVNSVTNTIYVANEGSNSVTVLDGAGNSAPVTLPVGDSPLALAVNTLTNRIYVANNGSASVTLIAGPPSGNNASIAGTMGAGNAPDAVAVNPATNMAYIANAGDGTVTVYNGSNYVATLTVGSTPYALTVNPVNSQVYVANSGSNSVTVIANNAVAATVAVGSVPQGLAVNPATNQVYVTNSGSATLSVIDATANTVTATLTVGTTPQAVSVNPATNRIYIANNGGASVSVVNGAAYGTATISTTSGVPYVLAVNSVTNKIYVSSVLVTGCSSGALAVIDGNTNVVIKTMCVAFNGGTAAAVNPVTNKIYFVSPNTNTATVIDGNTDTVVATVSVGANPTAIAVNPTTNMVYASSQGNGSNGTIAVIDGATNGRTNYAFSGYLGGVVVNPVTNKVYFAAGSAFLVMDGATNARTTVSAGSWCNAVAVNTKTNKVFCGGPGYFNILDGATNAVTSTSIGATVVFLEINPITNRVYAATDSGSVIVLDGNNNFAAATLPLTGSNAPTGIAVDSVANRIYVSNLDMNITVIDGQTSTISSVAAGQCPEMISFNSLNGSVYVLNDQTPSVTVITPNTIRTVPLTTTIVPAWSPLGSWPAMAALNRTPSFTVTVNSTYSPNAPVPTALYYQLDTAQGTWQMATPTTPGANPATFTVTPTMPAPACNGTPCQPLGHHILYAYAVYGDEGGAQGPGNPAGNSPMIGNLAAYAFVEMISPTTTTLTSSPNPVQMNSPVTLTAAVSPCGLGNYVPTGTVNILDGSTTICSALPLNGSCQATCTATFTTGGSHSLTAKYSGDMYSSGDGGAYFGYSAGSFTQSVSYFTVSYSPSSFGNVIRGYGSPKTITVTVKNPSGQPKLTGLGFYVDAITAVTPTDCNVANNPTAVAMPAGGTCTQGGSLNPNTSCTFSVVLTVNDCERYGTSYHPVVHVSGMQTGSQAVSNDLGGTAN